MPNVHSTRPLSVRLSAGDRERLSAFAASTGQKVNAVAVAAIAEYLTAHGGTTPAHGGNTTDVASQPRGTTTRKQPQAAPRRRSAPKAAPPIAAVPAELEQADTDTRAACKHPTASINEIGVCECGTEMDPA